MRSPQNMKIATWNLERVVKNSTKSLTIIESLKNINADILILTETNEFIDLGEDYNILHSTKLTVTLYKEGERRVSIYSKYKILGQSETFNNETSICSTLATPFGKLAVYGTIIGIFGNRNENFNTDLDKQLLDFEKFSKQENICIAGDFNISFFDNYYFTETGRLKLNSAFENLHLRNLTKNIAENIDHIVMTEKFIENCNFKTETWNLDKKLSDHIGVCVTISKLDN